MKNFTLYLADCIGNQKNCLYPHKTIVKDVESLTMAAMRDHVTAAYKDNYRNTANFLSADNVPLDCDNDHSENEHDWVTPLDVALAFAGVPFAVVYSQNHLKAKGEKCARPRFHVFFPIEPISDPVKYAELKRRIAAAFPYFDNAALDSARFLYGVENPVAEMYDGDTLITDYLEGMEFAEWDASTKDVPEGKRNSTMSHIAGKLIKRYGDTDKARELYLKAAEKCSPPLEEKELATIWSSAIRFGKRISEQEGYIPPEQFNSGLRFKPSDFTDVGQAKMLKNTYEGIIRYSPQTDYIVYNGSYWEESKPKAQAVAQSLTEEQLAEAEVEIAKSKKELMENDAFSLILALGPKKAAEQMDDKQKQVFAKYKAALEYQAYALKRRDSKNITSCLKEARPMLEIEQRLLDVDEFLLNTVSMTYDLRRGLESPNSHNSEDFITKQTAVDPNDIGMELWLEALDTFFCRDAELVDYVQRIVGLSVIGKVYVEALIIAYGEGRNGKSTFWNVIARVLGSYSGNISADMLTAGCKRNVKPELAEAKGKRLLIAAELEEGMRLNTSNVKQLCSTDEVYAEKKYKDPFSYVPTHTLVLYTNHLPRVGAIDRGTWRRLIVIPFDAKIEGNNDIKNYADYLFHNAGGAILSWVIEGAKKVIADDYRIKMPGKVTKAIHVYKENNDWLGQFFEACCELAPSFSEKSGELYNEYRTYCNRSGEYIRSSADFYGALELVGMGRYRTSKGRFIRGLRLKSEFFSEP